MDDNTIDAVIRCVEDATQTITVCTPSDDYYRRSEDWTSDKLTYVCPRTLVEALTNLKGGGK